MREKGRGARWVVLALVVQAVVAVAAVPPASASRVDAAMFFQVLAPHGAWVDFPDYGPVWYPTRVAANWRPYLDGRWVPTSEGWVFETSEPWGWATYHFGNWMPTADLGWVWVPGSTWYPSTVAWRVGGDFVGWAPVPPPDFIPPPAFAGRGYVPGTPILDLLTPPFWIFVNAPNLLLGFGQPFAPAFSYLNCGCLAPARFVPALYPQTLLLTDYFFPRYAPRAFFAFGLPFSSVAVFSNIKLTRINQFAQSVNLRALINVLPGAALFSSQAFLRNAIPGPVLKGERFQVRPVPDFRVAERNLVRPGVIPLPPGVPRFKAEIPRVLVTSATRPITPEVIKGMRIVRGELPPQAELETRVLRHEFPRPRPAPALGAIGIPAEGQPQVRARGRAFYAEGRRRWPLTTEEENLKRQLETQLLEEQILRARRFHRRFEFLPERSRGQLPQGLGPILEPIRPPAGRPGRAFFSTR